MGESRNFLYITFFAFCILLIDFFYYVYLFDMFYLFCFFYMFIFLYIVYIYNIVVYIYYLLIYYNISDIIVYSLIVLACLLSVAFGLLFPFSLYPFSPLYLRCVVCVPVCFSLLFTFNTKLT